MVVTVLTAIEMASPTVLALPAASVKALAPTDTEAVVVLSAVGVNTAV